MMGMMQEMAVDAAAFVTGGAPVVNAAKEFDRFMKSYEFAIEAQQLKREDVRDLVELIVDRMDMYHLIGALLLEFCVAFYGQFKLFEEEYAEEPLFVLEIFLISNIAAIGYLLFAVWLSLHASVAAHAIGVEFLLESSRLTIPTPENLREMRQSTSLFRQIYALFEDAERDPASARSRAMRQGANPDNMITPLVDTSITAGAGRFPLALEQAMDPMEHRHRFAESHRSWLRFDAYSRVCMALGINQMLQAMSYFIVGPIQARRPTSAVLTLTGVQVIALLLLKLDLRKTDVEEDTFMFDQDSDDGSDDGSETAFMKAGGSKDVSRTSWGDLFMVCSTYTLGPMWTVMMLWMNRFIKETLHTHWLLYSITPVFFMHAAWLAVVLRVIRPHEGDLLPLRLRTVGYLDIFTKDQLDPDHPSSPRIARYDAASPHGVHRHHVGERMTAHAAGLAAESVPWLVVNRFTKTMICMWIFGGAMHFCHTFLRAMTGVDFETTDGEEDPDEEWENRAEEELTAEELEAIEHGDADGTRATTRRLLALAPWRQREALPVAAAWPTPAAFFEVAGLHCNRSHVTVRSPFRVYVAERSVQELSIGPFAEMGRFEAAAMLCSTAGRCDALVRSAAGTGSWWLKQFGSARSAVGEPLPIPGDWRLVAGAWVPCKPGPCEEATLAGWDGNRIAVGGIRRVDASSGWRFRRWFFIDFGAAMERQCAARGHGVAAVAAPGTCASKELSFKQVALQMLDSHKALQRKKSEDPAQAFRQVAALQIDPFLKTMVVLHTSGGNSILTGWDTASGAFVGKWHTSGPYSAMCHDGREVMLARPGREQGPILETLVLPNRFLQHQRKMLEAEHRRNSSAAAFKQPVPVVAARQRSARD